MNPLLLKNGRIIDPASRRDETGDLLIVDGRIAAPVTGHQSPIPLAISPILNTYLEMKRLHSLHELHRNIPTYTSLQRE